MMETNINNSIESEPKIKKELLKSLEKIKNKRKKLNTVTHDSSRKKILNELFQEVGALEKVVGNLVIDYQNVDNNSKEELLQNLIENGLQKYNDYTQKMENLIKEEKMIFESHMLSEEEIQSIRSQFLKQKMDINQASILAKKDIFDSKKMLKKIKGFSEKNTSSIELDEPIKEAVHEAAINREALDIIFQEIQKEEIEKKEAVHEAAVNKVNIDNISNEIKNATQENGGGAFTHMVNLKSEMHSDISDEIQNVVNNHNTEDIESAVIPSLKDKIESLIFVDREYLESGYPRILLLNPNQMSTIDKYVDSVPLKVIGTSKNVDYIPDEAPSDLKHMISVEEKPIEQVNSFNQKQIETSMKDNKEEIVTKIEYQAININPSNRFLNSLKGEEQYNIIHSTKSNKQISSNLFKYLNGDLQKEIEEYNEILEQLSDMQLLDAIYKKEESDVLNTLSDHVLERVKNYVISNLELCEYQLREEYANLFYNISQIKMLEENLPLSNDDAVKISYIQERRIRLKKAVSTIKEIINTRENADYLLGKGIFINISRVHEDFPYIGKKYDRNLALEVEKLIDDGQIKLEEAIKENDLEGIVSNFINVDSCYYEDMKVENFKDNSRSVGVKYYDILANEFRYVDDELSRKLVEAKVLSAAETHVASAEFIYDVKSDKLLKDNVLPLASEEWNMDTSNISDDIHKMDMVIIDYQTRQISSEEVSQGLEYLSYKSHSRLVELVNKIVSQLRDYKDKYPELDVDALQEKLEVIIVHPEIISTKRIDDTGVMLRYLSDLPKDALINLILSSSASFVISEISTEILDKYNHRIEK